MSSPISKPACPCGSTLTRICPACGKDGNVVVDDEQMFNCPVGWIKMDNAVSGLPPDCPPYFVCSKKCQEDFIDMQKLLAAWRRGDPSVVVEKLGNGKSRIYRIDSEG